jgi:sn-glycerol 3-phosphate transport system substrate-binding protein
MKGIVSIVLALAVSAALVACGGEEQVPAGPSKPVTIAFWHSMPAANGEAIERLADTFNRSQDEVVVTPVYQGTFENSLNKFLASLGSAELPALIQLSSWATQLAADSGAVTPVQQFIDREGYDLSDFDPKVVEYYRVGGSLYSMPLEVVNSVLYYNKAAFREVGLDPERPPTTLEEVREYSERLLRRDAAGNVTRSGMALEVQPGVLELMLAMCGDLFVNNGNGRDGRATEAIFNGPHGQAFFRWWHDMVASGLGINVGRDPSGADHFLAIAAGRAAMTIGNAEALRSILNVLEAGEIKGVELGVAPVPRLADCPGGTMPIGESLWIVSERSEEEQGAAWKFISFLVAPEQQATWYASTGYIPVRRSALEMEAAREVEAQTPYFRVAVDQFLASPSNRATQGPLIGPYPQVREAIAQAYEQTAAGKDPVEALDEAARRATEEIRSYAERIGQ